MPLRVSCEYLKMQLVFASQIKSGATGLFIDKGVQGPREIFKSKCWLFVLLFSCLYKKNNGIYFSWSESIYFHVACCV